MLRRADAVWLLPVAAFLTLLSWHPGRLAPETGLDNSWHIALALAAQHGLDFGHDVVFTYGPLGFLSEPVLVSWTAGGLAFAYALLAQLVVTTVVLVAATRLYGRLAGAVVAFLALGLTLLVSDLLSFLALFGSIWALERDEAPSAPWLVPAAGFVAAFELLVKLNGGVLCLVLFALAAWRAAPRRWRSELVLAVSFAFSLVVLWLVTRNSLASLPPWLRESSHVVRSYTDAMAIAGGGRTGETVLAVVLVVATAALVVLQVRPLPRPRAVCLALAAAAFVYAYLKEGFVRYDVHALQFFGAVALVALAFAWRGGLRWAGLALVGGAILATAVAPDGVLYPVAANVRAAATIADTHLGRARAEARARLGVPATQLAFLRGHTVDSVPYETSAIWAYGLRWRPEPLLQWYMAYDAHLDAMNARGVRAERVLVQRTTTATDAKVPAFEAPATYLALLCNYRELAADGSWETLGRTADRCGAPRELAAAHFAANETIVVPPARPGELVVAHVHMPVSHLLSAIAKPFSFPHITIGGNTYRLVAETASGPLVVREPASAGRSPFFGGYTEYDSFSLSRAATVEFDAIPIHGSSAPVRLDAAPSAGRLGSASLTAKGRTYAIAAGALTGWVDLARATTAGIDAIAGWALAPTVAVYVDGRLVAVVHPAETRTDVSDALGDARARRSGYTAFFHGGAHVRVFALGGGKATELNYPPGYPWH